MSIGRRSWIFLGLVGVELDLALSFLNQMVGGACQTVASATKRGGAQRIGSPALDRRNTDINYPLHAGDSPEHARSSNSRSQGREPPHIQRKQQILTTDGILARNAVGYTVWLLCVLKE